MITLVDYFCNFLKPYTHLPEFTSCVMKALERLGQKDSDEEIYNELLTEERRRDPGRFKVCDIE